MSATNGSRLNFRDRRLECVNVVNVTVWTPTQASAGAVNGLAFGLPAMGAARINGLGLGVLGGAAERRVRGVAIGPVGLGAGQEVSGVAIGGIGAVTGRDLNGIGIGGIGLGCARDLRGMWRREALRVMG